MQQKETNRNGAQSARTTTCMISANIWLCLTKTISTIEFLNLSTFKHCISKKKNPLYAFGGIRKKCPLA